VLYTQRFLMTLFRFV